MPPKTPDDQVVAPDRGALDEALRPHLSALVDGELEPLEVIAVQQHVRQSAKLAGEVNELERLKVAVHLAGTRDKAPAALEAMLQRRVREGFATRRERSAWRWLLPVGGLVAAAAAALVMVSGTGGEAEPVRAAAAPKVEPVKVDGTDKVLARLVDFHRGDASPMNLREMQSAGVLVTVERLPDSFMEPEQNRLKLMQVSTMGCNEREVGSTLAVLRADRVDLPPQVDNALEMTGVWLETVDGVEVRLSMSGDKLIVLLSGDGRSTSADPI